MCLALYCKSSTRSFSMIASALDVMPASIRSLVSRRLVEIFRSSTEAVADLDPRSDFLTIYGNPGHSSSTAVISGVDGIRYGNSGIVFVSSSCSVLSAESPDANLLLSPLAPNDKSRLNLLIDTAFVIGILEGECNI